MESPDSAAGSQPDIISIGAAGSLGMRQLAAAFGINQIEDDAAAGKLDRFIEEALAEHRQGKTRPLP